MFISGMDLSRTYIAHHELESNFMIKNLLRHGCMCDGKTVGN